MRQGQPAISRPILPFRSATRFYGSCCRAWRIGAISGMLWCAGCERANRQDLLPHADAAACKPGVYLLELPRAGGFLLNHDLRDSAHVSRWIHDALVNRDTALRIVYIRVDSTRRDELRWLVPAIRSVGGRAYAEDGSCNPVVREPP